MPRARTLTVAYTPDSDDAFYYFGLESGRVALPGFRPEFRREPMAVLNRAALVGTYDVTAISSVVYPQVAERYAILSVGTSVGRGYGPVLVICAFLDAPAAIVILVPRLGGDRAHSHPESSEQLENCDATRRATRG